MSDGCSVYLPSCSCGQRISPCCGHSWGPLAGYHTQRAGVSCPSAAGTGTDGTAEGAPLPAAGGTQGLQYPRPQGAKQQQTNRWLDLYTPQ